MVFYRHYGPYPHLNTTREMIAILLAASSLVTVFTDRVRSTRGGNIFSLFVCSQGGVPHPADGGGTLSSSRRGGTLSSSRWGGGILSSSRQWGGTLSRSRRGGYPVQLQAGGVPCPGPGSGGVPCPAPGGGTLSSSRWEGGYPVQLQAGGVPPLGQGNSPRPGYPPYRNIAWTCFCFLELPQLHSTIVYIKLSSRTDP